MERIETKSEMLKKYLQEKEKYEKELLTNFQIDDVRWRDEYRAGNISYEEYKDKLYAYNKLVMASEEKYKKFLTDLHSNKKENV